MTAGVGAQHSYSCLQLLAKSLSQTSQNGPQIGTKEFVEVCDTILPFFDHLGPVFHVARGEFQQKIDTLKVQAEHKPLLVEIVEADRKANRATVKNSATRNLHRLCAAILFIKLLFENLISHTAAAATEAAAAEVAAAAKAETAAAAAGGSGAVLTVTLREAASSAYEAALAPFHTTIVKGVVRAGMLTLPSKEHFIASIGESEGSAAARAVEVVAACQSVHSAVSALLEGIDMPASNVWVWPSRS